MTNLFISKDICTKIIGTVHIGNIGNHVCMMFFLLLFSEIDGEAQHTLYQNTLNPITRCLTDHHTAL